MTDWNFADLLECVALALPDAIAVRQGDREVPYGELLSTVDAFGASLTERGAQLQDKVGVYLYNCPEYLVVTMGALHA
ncbi:MAG TPA: AMP-binding protein, partial [Acidimicrobiales bacterium]|nr:AMP-binding protein [Acidimicrobiales bacterium]